MRPAEHVVAVPVRVERPPEKRSPEETISRRVHRAPDGLDAARGILLGCALGGMLWLAVAAAIVSLL